MHRLAGWFVVSCLALVGACGDDGGTTTPADAGSSACVVDEDCDDGRFCNGVETCVPDSLEADAVGCVPGERPCAATESCHEDSDVCVPPCDVDPDFDGDGHDAVACGGDDCDDTDARRFPGNPEVCDAEGHDEDCNPDTFGDRDADGDGHVDARCCNGSVCGDDCNDLRPTVSPTNTEACDDIDNDCDGEVDEGVLVPAFLDMDRDLHGDPDMPVMSCPGRVGIAMVGDDCDDADVTVHGGQPEICDGRDNDCDGMVDESPRAVTWYGDSDGDGFGSAETGTVVSCAPVPGHSLLQTDCDDASRGINPGVPEQCNGRDDDCNGVADFRNPVGDGEDDDGDGVPDVICGGGVGADCDDTRPDVAPGAVEVCDGFDNDCDSEVDVDAVDAQWWVDLDRDGYGDESEAPIVACEPQIGRVTRGGDCDDSDAARRPGVPDGCDAVDQDCDGEIDEDSPRTAFYGDGDGDGFGGGAAVLACIAPAGLTDQPADCDDADATVNPAAMEACDGVDQNCDGSVDEGVLITFYPDGDGDGYGVPGTTTTGCTPPTGFADNSTDCDDADPTEHPGAVELCDSEDDDCDGSIDEMAAAACTLPNGITACMSGACVLAGCMGSYRDCDGVPSNGCEIDVDRSVLHCGACGAPACNAGASCVGGSCDLAMAGVATGSGHSCALRANGRVVCWGDSTAGRLGTGSGAPVPYPSSPVGGITDGTAIFSGWSATCVERSSGGFWCWGLNTITGVRGDGTTSSGPTATQILVADAVDLDIGLDFGCAVRSGGGVACWGEGNNGRLGNGSTTDSRTPVGVSGVTNAVDVAVSQGAGHACAVLATGAVRCWGQGNAGQLGNGLLLEFRTPVDVTGVVDATEVAATITTSCVRTTTNRVRCWGNNNFGQVGNGGAAAFYFTQQVVSGLTDAAALVAGGDHFCALRSTGQVACWGNNNSGQLGNGTTTRSTTPTAVTGITDAVAVDGSSQTGCALRMGGQVVCWGDAATHQLGYGTTIDSYVPVTVIGLP